MVLAMVTAFAGDVEVFGGVSKQELPVYPSVFLQRLAVFSAKPLPVPGISLSGG